VDDIDLLLLRRVLVIFLILWVVFTFYTLFYPFYGIYRQAGYSLHLLLACAVFILGYKGLKQPELFAVMETLDAIDSTAATAAPEAPEVDQVDAGAMADEGPAEKYRKSALDKAQMDEILSGRDCKRGLLLLRQAHICPWGRDCNGIGIHSAGQCPRLTGQPGCPAR
jgi:hypothetical protein